MGMKECGKPPPVREELGEGPTRPALDGCRPHGAQAKAVRGQQQVLHGCGAVYDPVARVFFHPRVAADEDSRRGLGGHVHMRVNAGHFRQQGGLAHHDELPGLLVACAGRGHGGGEQRAQLLVGDRPLGVLADAAAGENGVHDVHEDLLVLCGGVRQTTFGTPTPSRGRRQRPGS
jgi:hypothetical protein